MSTSQRAKTLVSGSKDFTASSVVAGAVSSEANASVGKGSEIPPNFLLHEALISRAGRPA